MSLTDLSLPTTTWTERLAFEVALALEGSGESLNDICHRHGIALDKVRKFQQDKSFLKSVKAFREDIRENGVTFKVKARAQAEELLKTSWEMIHDKDVSHAVRADLIKQTVKWAGLDGKSEESAGAAGGVKININFGGTESLMVTANPEDDTIEHDPHI